MELSRRPLDIGLVFRRDVQDGDMNLGDDSEESKNKREEV
jgi:hypothetical protein